MMNATQLRKLLESCNDWPADWNAKCREDYIERMIARLVLHE